MHSLKKILPLIVLLVALTAGATAHAAGSSAPRVVSASLETAPSVGKKTVAVYFKTDKRIGRKDNRKSLDGYVDHLAFGPGPALLRHFIEQARGQTGSVYGRRLYEVMRYWDEDHPEWDAEERDFAAAWRSQPKWVVSRSLKSVGPNATLVKDDVEAVIRGLKAQLVGECQSASNFDPRSASNLDPR